MYYNELKMYCKSEGLSEYMLSEVKISRKEAEPEKAKKPLNDKKDPSALKREAC